VLNILTGKLDTTGGMMFTQPAIDLVALGAMAGQRGHSGRRVRSSYEAGVSASARWSTAG
jgi:hypothetical protein